MTRARVFRRAVAVLAVAVVLGSGVGVGGFGAGSATAATSTQVSGVVFLDFDGDGVFDVEVEDDNDDDDGSAASSGTAVDAPLAGVTVTAYQASGAPISVVTVGDVSDAPDAPAAPYNYTISGLAPNEWVRIEFDLPAGTYDSFRNEKSSTSVRFVQAGDGQANQGVVRPDDYNQGDPFVATVLQRPGLRTSDIANEPAVVLTRWSDRVNRPDFRSVLQARMEHDEQEVLAGDA